MKPLGEKSWTQFAIADKTHSSQSYPVLKSSSTTLVQTEKAKAIDPSFTRSSEGSNSFNFTPLRQESPQIGDDSNHPILYPVEQSQDQPGIVLSTPSEDENQTIVLHTSTAPSEALDIARDTLTSLKKKEEAEMPGLHGSGTISPCSESSINDLIQSMPDTPNDDQPGMFRATLPIRLRMPRIEVSESSIDGSLDVQYAVSEASNTASASLDLERVSRSLSKLAAITQEPSYDGPALELDGTKNIDYEHPQTCCPPILEHLESFDDSSKPLSAQSELKPSDTVDKVSDQTDEDTISRLVAAENAAGSLPVKDSIEKAALPCHPESANLNAAIPTRIETELTPPPDQKRGKAKSNAATFLRRARRVVLRKPILSLVLGRQLAAPTSKMLKKASQGVPLDTSETAMDSVEVEPVAISASL